MNLKYTTLKLRCTDCTIIIFKEDFEIFKDIRIGSRFKAVVKSGKVVFIILKNSQMDNIYIQTLKLGFDNPKGISFNEVVEKLSIDLTDEEFEKCYTLWFYDNFFNTRKEDELSRYGSTMAGYWRETGFINIEIFHKSLSFMKGDAVNKYIDYQELERTRKSAKQASIYSTVSIILAFIAIIISLFLNPKQPYEVKIIEDSDKEKIVLPKVIHPNQSMVSGKDTALNIVPN